MAGPVSDINVVDHHRVIECRYAAATRAGVIDRAVFREHFKGGSKAKVVEMSALEAGLDPESTRCIPIS